MCAVVRGICRVTSVEVTGSGIMRLQQASAYGVFATVHVAAHQDQAPIPGKDIAESCGIPLEPLLAILEKLVQAQILTRQREPPHGFALNKPPGEISLLEIVEAIEGKQEPELLLPRGAGSTNAASSGYAPPLQPVGSLAASLLGAKTIADLCTSSGCS